VAPDFSYRISYIYSFLHRTFMRLLLIFISCFFLFSVKPFQKDPEVVDLKAHFDAYGLEGCFMMLNPDGTCVVYNPERCNNGFIPKSTFKIPHALIALEEGVLRDEDQVIQWDGTNYDIQAWNQDQNLATAIKYSCVWFFSALTEIINTSTYLAFLEKFGYGNRKIAGPPSRFWLIGDLRISAGEQVEFLNRFYHYQLGISKRSIDLVKKLILVEETDEYRMYAKTGGGPLDDDSHIMWYVGFVEKGGKVYVFAMNFTCDDYTAETAGSRIKITRSILNELGILSDI
jgi:beta-lactamase class D